MILALCCMTMMLATANAESAPQHPPRVVDDLQLSRYVGRWYEIAHIPNRFQSKCASNTTAEYTLQEDGRIEVINRCRKENGKIMEARGIARIASGGNPARLEVSFVSILGKQLFWGDYWVIGLDADYEWAIVGHPQRKYGWILARQPSLDDATLARIVARLKEAGYDPRDFEFTKQDALR
ncbi:MAG TPA: lipocalin family protein [Candidatus Krumholzibacteria bacterium]|nr:lipocalin family protein [Candidatus Krumholzibacteria bacterium]